MSAPRPSLPGPAQPGPAARTARRRRTRRIAFTAAAVLAAGFVAVPSALGAAWLPWSPASDDSTVGEAAVAPLTEVPADKPDKGLVHAGLRAAPKGTACVGKYEVVKTGDCSHGPDEVPAGLDVRKPVSPVAPAKPEGALPESDAAAPAGPAAGPVVIPDNGPASTALATDGAPLGESTPLAEAAVGPDGVVCDGDGTTGKRVQVLYVREAQTASRFGQYQESFRKWAAGVDAIYDASAKETGGSRHVRYVTTADCKVDVREVEVPNGALADFGTNMDALKKLGWNRTDRKYMIFAESKVYCGIGTFTGDEKPGADNRNNGGSGGTSYGRSDSGCWTAGVAAHELGHNLGAVAKNAPNSSKVGHCVDDYDLMCYKDAPATVMQIKCNNKAGDNRLDCNHDDYYHTNPAPGSYLAKNWNVANNQFLIKGDTGNPDPSPSPSKSPSPSPVKPSPASPSPSKPTPSPSVSPSPVRPSEYPSPSPVRPSPVKPSPSVSDGPGETAKITTSDLRPTSVRLSWPSAGRGAKYGLVVNGKTLSQWVSVTSVRLVALTPGTEYRISVVTGSAQAPKPHTAEITVTTPAASTPQAGSWFTLTNALTGTVADLYGGRSADRTPVTLFEAHGAANQQWKLEQAAAGFKLVSKATGKCLSPLGSAAGSPLVQKGCADAAVFTVKAGATGLTLSTADLVVGLGTRNFGGQRLLVLQKPAGARYQSWTALPA